jgi:hypothetical protein
MLDVVNGYDGPPQMFVIIKTKLMMMANTVFERNKDDVLWRLLTTRLPSATTSGKCEKVLSMTIMWAEFLAADDPDAMQIEQSAFFKAKMSLTPSPVIATLCP